MTRKYFFFPFFFCKMMFISHNHSLDQSYLDFRADNSTVVIIGVKSSVLIKFHLDQRAHRNEQYQVHLRSSLCVRDFSVPFTCVKLFSEELTAEYLFSFTFSAFLSSFFPSLSPSSEVCSLPPLVLRLLSLSL